jgi:hypothetical protein
VQNLWGVGHLLRRRHQRRKHRQSITGNTVSNIDGSFQPTGILVLQASGSVIGNTISGVQVRLGTNFIDGTAYAPNLTIQGNNISDVSVGMDLSGLDTGSLVRRSRTVGDANTIDLTTGTALTTSAWSCSFLSARSPCRRT